MNRSDFEAALGIARPDIELNRSSIEPPLKGVAAVREWMEPDAFEVQRYEPLDCEANGNKVLVRQHLFPRGAGSGIELDIGSRAVWSFDDDGFVARTEVYSLDQEADVRQAAGLSE
jgi:hypothetical protein